VGFFSVALSGQTARPPALLGTAEFRLSSAGGGVWCGGSRDSQTLTF